jgi:organic radical activating enzyme
MDELAKPQIKGLSILGGEPFDQPDLYHLVNLVRLVKEHYPEKDI